MTHRAWKGPSTISPQAILGVAFFSAQGIVDIQVDIPSRVHRCGHPVGLWPALRPGGPAPSFPTVASCFWSCGPATGASRSQLSLGPRWVKRKTARPPGGSHFRWLKTGLPSSVLLLAVRNENRGVSTGGSPRCRP